MAMAESFADQAALLPKMPSGELRLPSGLEKISTAN